MVSLAEARAVVLGEAEPVESVEVGLTEALGLVLAEPLSGDVDLPPFDRALHDGYAARADDARAGSRLRVVGPRRGGRAAPAEVTLGPGEAAHVTAGDPLPVGADAVVRTEDSRPDPGVGPPREVVVLRTPGAGQGVVPRGYYLAAGATLASAGERLRLPMVGLLAAQGCVHPVCHRRVRVAVLAVGDHLVGPAEAPVMHRERNAAGPAAVAPCLHWGATAHDLGTVTERDLPAALDRALTAPVVLVLGPPEGAIPRALRRAGVEPRFAGVALHPGKRLGYGVVRGGSGRAAHHVFQMAPGPVGVLTGVALLVGPLVARLQGGPPAPPTPLRALWSGPAHRPTDDRLWAVPVTLSVGDDARLRVTPIDHRGKDDLVGFSRADALALLPPRSGPWTGGEVVEVVSLGAWPPGAPTWA
jgi:molybdopterin molybdotransferase